MNPPAGDRSLRITLSLLLAAIVFVAFSPSLHNDFIGWDDNHYITDNPYISPLSFGLVGSIFSSIYFQSYTPLTLLAHALLFKVFGLDPRGHHLANLLLHALNGSLVFLLAVRLLGAREGLRGLRLQTSPLPPAVLYAGGIGASLFFAFSPLRLEPILAAYSLKDVLSAFLALASVLAYWRHMEERAGRPAGRYLWISLFLFFLAILAKSATAALPAVLILLDLLRDGHLTRPKIMEKLPFFLLAAGIVVVGMIATRDDPEGAGMTGVPAEKYPWLSGLFNVGFYLFRSVWPGETILVYLPVLGPRTYSIAALPFVATAVCALFWWRGIRAPLYAWGAYLILLFPVAHFFPVLAQVTAARYAYLSALPFALLFGAAVAMGVARAGGRRGRLLAGGAFMLIPGALAFLSVSQIGGWSDAETIWRRTLKANPDNSFLFVQMGDAKKDKGDKDSAGVYYKWALALDTNSADLRCRLADIALLRGDTGVAALYLADRRVEHEETVLRYVTLGSLRLHQGRREEALSAFERGAAINPASYQSYFDAGYVLQMLGRYREAFAAAERALRVNPSFADAHYLRGILLERNFGDQEGACVSYRRAARLGYLPAQKRLIELGLSW
jgi:tetratricopeptide (TPR) repeat protein